MKPMTASVTRSEKLGRLLVNVRLITEDQLQKALSVQKKEGGRLGSILVRLQWMDETSLTQVLSQQHGLPCVDLSNTSVDLALIKLIPQEVLKKHCIFPVNRQGSLLRLAMADPTNVFAIDDIKFMTGYNVEPLVAAESAVLKKIDQYSGSGKGTTSPESGKSVSIEARDYTLDASDDSASGGVEIEEIAMVSVEDFDTVVGDALDTVNVVEEAQDEGLLKDVEAPIVKLVNSILVNGIKVGASDIHVEPLETALRVRLRIDGVMKTIISLPIKIRNAVVSRLKIMSKLDITERRLPQDGRIKLRLGKNREIDFRVSTVPCLFGEKVVMRILDKGNLQLDLAQLGFEPEALSGLQEALGLPYGMIVVTGPTGSGKTTTLYSALSTLNTQEVNIMTAEDPVEYNLKGINQVQMKEEIGLNFASAMRAFLRQDPDVIMVGEIRDHETAEIAIKAALTGHLVLSTLHTNDAPGTINRLLDMNIAPFLVASSMALIIAQRLTRKLCLQCRHVSPVRPDLLLKAGFREAELAGLSIYQAKGCEACNKTGYKGRVALYEVLPMREAIRGLVLRNASTDEIKTQAVALGMKTLRRSGLEKVRAGITTLEEVLENTASD
jgi:type IV pilus assembly protein PilB